MEYRVIRHAGYGSGSERVNHKYVARVKTSDGKGYRYFYTNAEYQAYLKESKSNSPTAYDAPYKPKKEERKLMDDGNSDRRYDEVHPEKKKEKLMDDGNSDRRYDEVHPEKKKEDKKTNVKVKRKKQKEKGEKYVSRMMSTKPTPISKSRR